MTAVDPCWSPLPLNAWRWFHNGDRAEPHLTPTASCCRPCRWHDLAFHEHTLFTNLKACLQAGDEIQGWGLTFAIDRPGPPSNPTETRHVDLRPGGGNIPVTRANAAEYVRLYAEYVMIVEIEQPLAAMRHGLRYVLPEKCMRGVVPEDFELLLNGVAELKVEALKDLIRVKLKQEAKREMGGWFWQVVEEFTQVQRAQLLCFFTGSMSLPEKEDADELR